MYSLRSLVEASRLWKSKLAELCPLDVIAEVMILAVCGIKTAPHSLIGFLGAATDIYLPTPMFLILKYIEI